MLMIYSTGIKNTIVFYTKEEVQLLDQFFFCNDKKRFFHSCHHLVLSINKYGFSVLSSALATTALGSESVFLYFD